MLNPAEHAIKMFRKIPKLKNNYDVLWLFFWRHVRDAQKQKTISLPQAKIVGTLWGKFFTASVENYTCSTLAFGCPIWYVIMSTLSGHKCHYLHVFFFFFSLFLTFCLFLIKSLDWLGNVKDRRILHKMHLISACEYRSRSNLKQKEAQNACAEVMFFRPQTNSFDCWS